MATPLLLNWTRPHASGKPQHDPWLACALKAHRDRPAPYSAGDTTRQATLERALNLAGNGEAEGATALAKAHRGLTAEFARSQFEHFRRSCENGNLGAAQWFVDTFELSKADLRPILHDALGSACLGGHLRVVQFLLARFDLTAEAARAHGNFALAGACGNGHVEVLRVLLTQLDPTAEDARSNHNYLLRIACELGHLSAAQMLVAHFGLTAEDAHSEDYEALRAARERGHRDVAQWLVAEFGESE